MTLLRLFIAVCALQLAGSANELTSGEKTIDCKVSGDWEVEVTYTNDNGRVQTGKFRVEPVTAVEVNDELCQAIPDFNPKAWNWGKGYAPRGIRAQECTVGGALEVATLVVADPNTGAALVRGKDYEVDDKWGVIGRLAEGGLAQKAPVRLRYSYYPQRIDSIVSTSAGLAYRAGIPDVSVPKAPALQADEIRLANIFIEGKRSALSQDNLFPILAEHFPEELLKKPAGYADRTLPRTLAKLRSGERLKILAWGDSVTDGRYMKDYEKYRWQAQFVTMLKKRFPKANIELITESWPSRNTDHYFAEPSGAPHNFKEKVLDVRPDLIVSEFINDQHFPADKIAQRYGAILEEFRNIGAEWIICTPHYPFPQSIGLSSQRNIDNDPRASVKAWREFASANGVALADVSVRYGHLWREGIPYMTLMLNAYNHPSAEGLGMYAEVLVNVFPEY